MAEGSKNLFWDSCVFYAYLSNASASYDIESIEQYLDETRAGRFVIYTSSIALAEVVPSAIKRDGIGTFTSFVNEFSGAIVPIDATPNVMTLASYLKDLPYKKGTSHNR
jgi:hypothetical protein